MVIVANHWNYVKSAFLFTWPPGWLPALPSPCLCSSARVHAHSFTLFILPVQTGDAMYAQVHYYILHAEHGYDTQSNHTFFPQFVRVFTRAD